MAVRRCRRRSTSPTKSVSTKPAICSSPRCRTMSCGAWTRKTKIISTVAGTGSAGIQRRRRPGGQGAIQAAAQHRLRSARAPAGLRHRQPPHPARRPEDAALIDTYAGTGEKKPTPDGAPLAGTPLNGPRALDLDPKGNLYLALREGNAVYRIDSEGRQDLSPRRHGREGLHGRRRTGASMAKLSGPKGIAWARDGGVYIADTESHTIRRIDLKTGVITTVARHRRARRRPRSAIRCSASSPARTASSSTRRGWSTWATASRTGSCC